MLNMRTKRNQRGLIIENNKVVGKRFCRYCKSTKNLTIDHMVPKSKGGEDETKNYQCLCMTCNGIKSGLSHKEVMRLFRWFLVVQLKRGDKRFKLKDRDYKKVGITPPLTN